MTRHPARALMAMTSLALVLSACTADPSPPSPGEQAPEASATSTGPAPSDSPDDTSPSATIEPRSTAAQTQDSTALGAWGVSSGHPSASKAGMLMLERGGSAVDAAVATAFADAVVQPAFSGIGGGGASIVVDGAEPAHYDYREYVNAAGVIPDDGVGVPGFVAGLRLMHDRYGVLPWEDLLAPAIDLAEDGAPVSAPLAAALSTARGREITGGLPHFTGDDGGPLREGDLLVQQELAATMRAIAEDPDTIYRGDLADQLLDVPGLDSPTLSDYEVQVAVPASGPVAEHTLLSGAPALPGAAIIQMIQIAEAAGIGEVDPDSADFVDLQTRAWQVAATSVQQFFGDPDYVDVPLDRLTDPQRNAEIAAELPGPTATSQASAQDAPYDGAANTTHISVVDTNGMAISMTNTITNYWGSGRYLGGFFLNNQLDRFSSIGVTDANTPQPGRRSVTWSSPSMVVDDQGRPVLVLGTPGGRQIPNITANVVTRWALHDQDLRSAIPAERFILTDGVLLLESGRLVQDLRDRGYDAQEIPAGDVASLGSVQALDIDWDQREVTSYADPRRSAGYSVASDEEPIPTSGP